LREGHEAWRVNQSRPLGFALLAAVLVQQGEHAAALAMVRDGLKLQEETGHGLWNAELHRFEGIALFGLNRLEEGQAALEEALWVARRQQARAYELRAATSLARLWRDQGRREKARELIAPVYGWFAEGFARRDLKEAKALLDELAVR
jgi:predicted ATPase